MTDIWGAKTKRKLFSRTRREEQTQSVGGGDGVRQRADMIIFRGSGKP